MSAEAFPKQNYPRSQTEIKQTLANLSKQTFPQLWNQRDSFQSTPIALPGFFSGYGVPITIGMRRIEKIVSFGFDFKSTNTYVLGLFEDRSALGDPSIEAVGHAVFTDRLQRKTLECFRAYAFHDAYESKDYRVNSDIFFKALSQAHKDQKTSYGIHIGFETYQNGKTIRRSTFQQNKISQDKNKIVHRGKGLGMPIIDLAILLCRQLGRDSLTFMQCNEYSKNLLEKSGYPLLTTSSTIIIPV